MGAFSRTSTIAAVFAVATCLASVASAAAPKSLVDARAKANADFPACVSKAPNIEGARGAHKAAKEFYESGSYQRAIRSWGDAYEFDCTKPEVFRNISNAYEKLADKPAALALLEIYLAREPNPDPNAKVKAQNLLREIEEDDKNKVAPAPTLAPSAPPTSSAAPVTPPGSYDATEEERPFGVAPWIVFGSGIALLGGGIPLIAVGASKISDANAQCPDRDACTNEAVRDLGNEGLTLQGVGIALTATGGAAVIAGLVWQLAGNQPRPVAASSSYVLPIAGKDQLGAIVGGTF